MVIKDCIIKASEILRASGIECSMLDARVLMKFVLKRDDVYIMTHDREDISGDDEKFFNLVNIRAAHKPMAYITNTKEFMSMEFYVDENVLIPRPDTEHLAMFAIDTASRNGFVNIGDFCTGSGALAVSVAKNCDFASVIGYDISDGALSIANKNKELLKVSNVSFEKRDILKETDFENKFDMVISNPPYIDKAQMQTLEKTVYDYEPHLALFGGNDGLDFYKAISGSARSFLKERGVLAFEVGHTQADRVKAIMENDFKDIGIIKDYAGIERVVYGQVK